MACEYCLWEIGHPCSCPNYEPPESNYTCAECGEKICYGDEYIENDAGDYAHWDCVVYGRDLAAFLGYEIKEMEEEEYD